MYHLSNEQVTSLVDEIQRYVSDKTLVLVRGLPGLGKSTFAKQLCVSLEGVQIENDMQFMVSGEYVFDPSKLEDAHMATQVEVRNLMLEEAPCVIVSNTFTREWEMLAYKANAQKFRYTVIVVDLLLGVLINSQEQKQKFNINQFLEFLYNTNVHSVPADKIRSMYDRYDYSTDVITVTNPTEDVERRDGTIGDVVTLEDSQCDFQLLDTGYYLALDLITPDTAEQQHSSIYRRCIKASQQILQLYGISCGYRMLRKLTVRNAKSHGLCYAMRQQEQLTQQPCTNPHANARSAVKLAAGWTRYHITILSPSEYDSLKKDDSYGAFLSQLREVDFSPLMRAAAAEITTTIKPQSSKNSTTERCSAVSVGCQKGAITEAAVGAVFPVDSLGSQAGLSETAHSTAVYLLLDANIATLQKIIDLRQLFGVETRALDSTTPPSAEGGWEPHITLAFSHNDVRSDPSNPEAWNKAAGIEKFQELYDTMVPGGSVAGLDTDLQSDLSQRTMATLLLHSEVQASFRTEQFGFILADLKVRRGVMGDDATYRAHPYLQTHLPRGLVYLQHNNSRDIYQGLFSLRKFYGKEGVEDDGIGISATQLAFKLGKVLDACSTILVMEKVNGRAASCRFLHCEGELYVIVGTKLSHVLCKVDTLKRCLVRADASNVSVEEEQQEETEELQDTVAGAEAGAIRPREEGGEAGSDSPSSPSPLALDLIASNITALESNLRWEHLSDFVAWLAGRTFNGEVLDPKEMHLVVLHRHEWMSLCVTQFVNQSLTVVHTADAEVDTGSALQDMLKLGEYTHCIPAYTSHDITTLSSTATVTETGVSESIATTITGTEQRNRKRAELSRITTEVVYARDSEGKVLYFLNTNGHVLELLKFKTWWYIWRRSIRELSSQLFSRYYNTPQRGKIMVQDTIEEEHLSSDIERLQNIYNQMHKAKPEAFKSEKFISRLEEVTCKLNIAKNQLEKLNIRRMKAPDYDTTYTAIELITRIQKKWPNKFNFFQNELGYNYINIIERVSKIAQKFIVWCKDTFRAEKDQFYYAFKQEYPVIWERFLIECQETDGF